MNATKHEADQWVETLLKANPVEVSDDGFSARILADIKRQEKHRLLILGPFFAAAFAIFLGFFPFEIFTGLGADFATSFGILKPYLVPLGVVVGMFMFSMFSEEVA